MVVNVICVTIIVVPTIWTFLFTHGFIKKDMKRHRDTLNKESYAVQKHVYSTKFKNLIGIFGTLLLFNAVAWVPLILTGITAIIIGFYNVPVQLYATTFVLFLTNNVSSPIIQSYFRKDLFNSLKRIFYKIIGNKNIPADSYSNSKMRQSANNLEKLDVDNSGKQNGKLVVENNVESAAKLSTTVSLSLPANEYDPAET